MPEALTDEGDPCSDPSAEAPSDHGDAHCVVHSGQADLLITPCVQVILFDDGLDVLHFVHMWVHGVPFLSITCMVNSVLGPTD